MDICLYRVFRPDDRSVADVATDLDEYFDHVLYFADPDGRRLDNGPLARWFGWWQRAADALIDSDDPLLNLSARQGFTVNTDQLRAAGVSRATTRARLANGRWISPRTGALTPLDLRSETPWLDLGRRASAARAERDVARRRTRAVAATASALLNQGHAISGRSAALLHGLPTFREPDRPILTAPARTTLGRRHSAVLARGAALTGADTATWFGAEVTTVARTVVDVARLDRWDGLFAADAALHGRVSTRAELGATTRCGGRRNARPSFARAATAWNECAGSTSPRAGRGPASGCARYSPSPDRLAPHRGRFWSPKSNHRVGEAHGPEVVTDGCCEEYTRPRRLVKTFTSPFVTSEPPHLPEHAMSTPTATARPDAHTPERVQSADVVVVGAGPAGSSAAYWLARSGLDVAVVEKTSFPREKVCGDGLTPRGTRALVDMGIDVSEANGWLHNRGLRVIGGGQRLHLDWPELTNFPPFGLVRPRADLDAMLAQQAVGAGARLYENTSVTDPVLDTTGRVVGVSGRTKDKEPVRFEAPLVLTCEGVSGKLAQRLDVHRNDKRPLGVAVRRYYTSPKTHDDYLESWLELWDGKPNQSDLLPGYGWIFGMGDGTVNAGLGVLNSSAGFQKTDYRAMLTRWLDNTPEAWGLREANAVGPTRGAALPMGFNRTPHYLRGLLLVGDSGGSVNPFNGEGIPYAMESGKFAAEAAIDALRLPAGTGREAVLSRYPQRMADEWGAYYRLGGVFVKLIGNPKVMQACTRHGLPHPALMRFVLKLLANLTDPSDVSGRDLSDRVINVLTRLTPAIR